MRRIAVVTGGGSLCIFSESKGRERERNGSSRGGAARAHPNEQNAGEKVGGVGSGGASGCHPCTTIGEGGSCWRKGKALTGGPRPSATEERGGGGTRCGLEWHKRAGPARKEVGEERRGLGLRGLKSGRGRGIPFYFSYKFSKPFSI